MQLQTPKNKEKKEKVPPTKMMSIRDEEMNSDEGHVQPQAMRTTFSFSKAADPCLISEEEEVLTPQPAGDTVQGIDQRCDDTVDLRNTQGGVQNLPKSTLEGPSEAAPKQTKRLNRTAKREDVESQGAHRPYKRPREANQESEHDLEARDDQLLELRIDEWMRNMEQAMEYVRSLRRTKAEAQERKAEAEERLAQANRRIAEEKELIRTIEARLESLEYHDVERGLPGA